MVHVLFGNAPWLLAALVIFGIGVFFWTGRGNRSLPDENKGGQPDWDWPLAPDLQARRGVSSQSRQYASKS